VSLLNIGIWVFYITGRGGGNTAAAFEDKAFYMIYVHSPENFHSPEGDSAVALAWFALCECFC